MSVTQESAHPGEGHAEKVPARSPPSIQELEAFDRSLKRRQQFVLIQRLLGPLGKHRCLLITGKGHTGALNFRLRAAGGRWSWAHTDPDRLLEISFLLGEPVSHAVPSSLPFPEGSFDRVVAVGVDRYADDPWSLEEEVFRVLRPGGRAVLTSAHARRSLALSVLHTALAREVPPPRGSTPLALERVARSVGLVPEVQGSCRRFFTEAVELAFRNGAGTSRFYPLLKAVAALDHLLPWVDGYTLGIAARKPQKEQRAGERVELEDDLA